MKETTISQPFGIYRGIPTDFFNVVIMADPSALIGLLEDYDEETVIQHVLEDLYPGCEIVAYDISEDYVIVRATMIEINSFTTFFSKS